MPRFRIEVVFPASQAPGWEEIEAVSLYEVRADTIDEAKGKLRKPGIVGTIPELCVVGVRED